MYGGKGGRKEQTSIDPVMAVPQEAYLGLRGQLRGILQGAEIARVVARSDYDLSAYVKKAGGWLRIDIQVTVGELHEIFGLLVQPSEPPDESDQ